MATIKKGTYRLIDEPSHILFYPEVTVSILGNFSLDVEGQTYFATFDSLTLFGVSDGASFLCNLTSLTPSVEDITPPVLFGIYYSHIDSTGTERTFNTRIINITEDTEVDNAFATWFIENTQMMIRAGTYKFKNTLTDYSGFTSVDIKFKLPEIKTTVIETGEEVTMLFDGQGIHFDLASLLPDTEEVDDNIMSFQGILTLKSDAGTEETGISYQAVYSPSKGWTYMSEGYGEVLVDVFNGYGQTIIVTEDTIVTDEFETWFTANTLPCLKGVWRWNEAPIIAEDRIFQSVDFTNKAFSGSKNQKAYYSGISLSDNSVIYEQVVKDSFGSTSYNITVYTSSTGWEGGEEQRLVAFLTEQAVEREFFDFFIENAQDITDQVATVEYNGEVRAVLIGGDSVTIPMKDFIAQTDIVITAPKITQEQTEASTESTANTLSGVWLLNETIDYMTYSSVWQKVNFSTMAEDIYNCTEMNFSGASNITYRWDGAHSSGSADMYDNGAWKSEGHRYIIFAEPQTVSADFYDIFTHNAKEITQNVMRVAYNGKYISAILNGGTATLKCKGKYMKGDLTVYGIGQLVYTLSGTWVFNETPNLDVAEFYENYLSFYYEDNGLQSTIYHGIKLIKDGDVSSLYYTWGNDGVEVYLAYSTSSGWESEGRKTITFTEQVIVTKEFYKWFTANATEATRTISGTWKFDDYIAYDPLYDIGQDVNFTTTDADGAKITCSSMEYLTIDMFILYNGIYAYASYTGWMSDSYRTIDFGTEPQTVTRKFYDWFTKNAKQQEV